MSNSNHDPKNKECAIYGEEHEKEIECEHPCTCRPEQKEEVVHASRCAADLDGCYDGSCLSIPEQEEESAEEFGADSEWLIPLYTDEVSIEDKKTAVRRLIALAEERGRREEVILFMESIQKKAETVPPNLLLNEVVNYSYDRIKTLTQKS